MFQAGSHSSYVETGHDDEPTVQQVDDPTLRQGVEEIGLIPQRTVPPWLWHRHHPQGIPLRVLRLEKQNSRGEKV